MLLEAVVMRDLAVGRALPVFRMVYIWQVLIIAEMDVQWGSNFRRAF